MIFDTRPKTKIYVYVDVGAGETVLAGQLIVNRTLRVGAFKYANSYCEHPKAYSLDPINLPLVQGAHYESPMSRDSLGIAGVLLDAGPDDWGRKVLIALLDPPPTNDLEFLLAGSGNGTGTITFSERRTDSLSVQEVPIKALPKEFQGLEDIMETALRLDEGLPVDKDKAMFFEYGSGLGGIRPKTFVDEVRYDEEKGKKSITRWIVKFPRKNDLVDNCLLEHATMKMAAAAGCVVAETKVMDTAKGPLLLIKRFDIDPKGERHHMISAQSLIGPVNMDLVTATEVVSYGNLGRIANQISDESNAKELFRRMLFNIAVGNVDDHPKNHAFMKPAGESSFQLTPAYDVLPTVGMAGNPQALSISPFGGHQSSKAISMCAAEIGICAEDAIDMANDVLVATRDWESHYRQAGLSEKEILIVRQNIGVGRQYIDQYLETLTEKELERAKRSMSITR